MRSVFSSPEPPTRAADVARRHPVLLRGAGDLGSGVALVLARAGVDLVLVDLPTPTALRLTVAFAAAALHGRASLEGFTAVRCDDIDAVQRARATGELPLWVRDEAELRAALPVSAIVDARLRGLSAPRLSVADAPWVVALGPGYEAGRHCHRVVETNRGAALGAVISAGSAEAHTGVPGEVAGERQRRVLRAACDGALRRVRAIGDFVEAGDVVAEVGGVPVRSAIAGMVRGLKLDGVAVRGGAKIGDVDPRRDRTLLRRPSDKAERVGLGVLRALRAREELAGDDSGAIR